MAMIRVQGLKMQPCLNDEPCSVIALHKTKGDDKKMWDVKPYGPAFRQSLERHSVKVGVSLASIAGLLTMGAGNYTSQYTPVASSVALASITDYVAFILDVLTAVGNWFVQNPVGELLIGMSVVMFAMIMIKSFFRRGGGKRR